MSAPAGSTRTAAAVAGRSSLPLPLFDDDGSLEDMGPGHEDERSEPHLSSPPIAPFIHRGPDATHAPHNAEACAAEEVAQALALSAAEEDDGGDMDDASAEDAIAGLLLPKIFLIRHGQSLFNAHHFAHQQLPDKAQSRLNFPRVPAPGSSSGGSGDNATAAAPPAAPLEDGSLVGGLPVIRARRPMTDARLLDAPLTPHGQDQARAAHAKARALGPIDLVLSTPLTRAIQTALLVFRPKDNRVDWSVANVPSLDQPLSNVTVAPPSEHPPPNTHFPLIRIIPHHVENLCASCDVGVPLSVLASRFASEPHMDFESAREMMSDCWWHGASVGANVNHLIIKRGAVPPGAASSSSAAAASAAPASRPSSGNASTRSSITLKKTNAMPSSGLNIVREQSESIEVRTRKLIAYLLRLAVEHARRGENNHRPMHVALVGHCGFFARLSGHTLDNTEILELEWSVLLRRAALKGFLTLPTGMKSSDVGDVRKHSRLIRHWLSEMGEEDALRESSAGGAERSAGSSGGGGSTQPRRGSGSSGSAGHGPVHYTAEHPPPSSNTADLAPRG